MRPLHTRTAMLLSIALYSALVVLTSASLRAQNPGAPPQVPNQAAPAPVRATADSIWGNVFDIEGAARRGIPLALNALNDSGALLYRGISVTDSNGAFVLRYTITDARPTRFRLDIDRQRITVDTMWLTGIKFHKWIERVRVEWPAVASGPGSRRLDLKLKYDTAPPFYTFLLFVPALFGLLAAANTARRMFFARKREREAGAGFLRRLRTAFGAFGEGYRNPSDIARRGAMLSYRPREVSDAVATQYAVASYVFIGCVAWVVVVAWFAIGYVRSDLQSIDLFSPNMHIPVLIPVAAFLGVLVFATSRLVELSNPEIKPNVRQELFLDLGNRVFIAPYVAIVAVLIAPFDTLDKAEPTLLAFATGLWIETVLEALKQLGLKLVPNNTRPTIATAATVSGATQLTDAPAQSDAPVPTITAATWSVKNGKAKLKVAGSGFRDRTTLTADGSALEITSRTPTELVASLPVAPSTTDVVFIVTATTTAPGGGSSSTTASAEGASNA